MAKTNERGHWNRAGRRSGGSTPVQLTGSGTVQRPALSIQCFEQRHVDCGGTLAPFGIGYCECSCHGRDTKRPK